MSAFTPPAAGDLPSGFSHNDTVDGLIDDIFGLLANKEPEVNVGISALLCAISLVGAEYGVDPTKLADDSRRYLLHVAPTAALVVSEGTA